MNERTGNALIDVQSQLSQRSHRLRHLESGAEATETNRSCALQEINDLKAETRRLKSMNESLLNEKDQLIVSETGLIVVCVGCAHVCAIVSFIARTFPFRSQIKLDAKTEQNHLLESKYDAEHGRVVQLRTEVSSARQQLE